MLATILYRLADSPSMTANVPFTDVPAGQWYSTPVTWAVGAGVVNGVGENKFAPAAPVTREQLAVMLRWRGNFSVVLFPFVTGKKES